MVEGRRPGKPPRPRDRPWGEPTPEPRTNPKPEDSVSTKTNETLELEIKKLRKELERRENSGVYSINTRELTNELARSFDAYNEAADKVVTQALRTSVKRAVIAVLAVVAAVATIAVGYVRTTPSPESLEVKETVKKRSEVEDEQIEALKKENAAIKKQVTDLDTTVDVSLGQIADRLDDLAERIPEKPKPRTRSRSQRDDTDVRE